MGLIKNFEKLAKNEARRKVLEIIETGLASIQPDHVIKNNFKIENNELKIHDQTISLENYKRIFLLGFGKGSAGNSKLLEQTLGARLAEGYVIDPKPETFSKISYTQGTHPLPSEENYKFTKNVIQKLSNLSPEDLVIVVICGGGSALFVSPNENITLEQKINVNKSLLQCGANITEMNMVRKHLSAVKGGGLAKALHPAKIVSLIFSDVPGNDLSVIASGPTVKDPTTVEDAWNVIQKYKITDQIGLKKEDFHETPKEDTYFENVTNIIFLSNMTALNAMLKKAQEMGINVSILSDKFQGEAREVGKELLSKVEPNSLLLVGGETTVTVKNKEGKGGRNQEVVLGTLHDLPHGSVIASVGTDGADNSPLAGAIGDFITFDSAVEHNLDPQEYLNQNNSQVFFETVEDGINTGRLESNVADLILLYKQ